MSKEKPAAQEAPPTSWRSDPDVALMQRVKRGDSAAFRDLFAKYNEAIVNFAFRFVGNRHRAEELTQDAEFRTGPRGTVQFFRSIGPAAATRRRRASPLISTGWSRTSA